MTYARLKKLISRGAYDKEDMMNKLDVFLMANRITEEQYQELDHTYILKKHKDTFGYRCLTDQKQFYQENYPGIVIEKGNIDELITIMIQGEKI